MRRKAVNDPIIYRERGVSFSRNCRAASVGEYNGVIKCY